MARAISEAPVIRAVLSDGDGEIASSQSVNTELPTAALLADNAALPTTPIVGAVPMLYNGATLNLQRGNTEGTLLASAARTATTNSAIQTNHNARGVVLFLNITATPGGAETLYLYLTMVDPVTGAGGVTSATHVTIPAATTGPFALVMYPGLLSAAMSDSRGFTRNGALPRTWLAQVIHSAGGSWTYSLSYAYVV